MEREPSAVEAQILNHWTTEEIQVIFNFVNASPQFINYSSFFYFLEIIFLSLSFFCFIFVLIVN